MRSYKAITMSAVLSLMLSSCSATYDQVESSKYYKKNSSSHFKSAIGNDENIKEIDVIPFLDLSTSKSLTNVLSYLSKLNNKVYVLDRESNDLLIPSCSNSQLLEINTMPKLNKYLLDRSDYRLELKNRKSNTQLKIISVVDKHRNVKNELKQQKINIVGNFNVYDALELINTKTNYSIIFKNTNSTNKKQPRVSRDNDLFFNIDKNRRIYFKGNNVLEFLEFISDYYDVFVDINYKTKVISISKYKTQFFTNLLYHGSGITSGAMNTGGVQSGAAMGGGAQSGGSSAMGAGAQQSGGGSAMGGGMNTAGGSAMTEGRGYDVEMFLEKIIPNAQTIYNEKSGILAVTATKSDMSKVSKLIEEFNEVYDTRMEVTLNVFEFVVKKEYSIGSDLSFLDSSISQPIDVTTSFLNKVLFDGATTSKNITKGIRTQSENNLLKLVNFNTFSLKLTNNVSDSIDLSTSTDYIKNITTTTTTTTTSPITNQTSEIDTTLDGSKVDILGRASGNKIFIKTLIEIYKTPTLSEKNIGNETIALPTRTVKRLPASMMLYDGERKVMGRFTTFDKADNYDGIVPIENFIIGGVSGNKMVKKEVIFTISVKREK